MYELRPYQIEAIEAIRNEWSEGRKKTILAQIVGTGKTVVFSSLIAKILNKNNNNRVLVLAHRNELLDQAREKIESICNISVGLEKAESTVVGKDYRVVLASIQTLSQPLRLEQFPKDYFKVIVVDEGHHSMSDTYQRVLNYFNNPFILGVTATPDRGDKKSLARFYHSIAYEYSLARAIREKYLVPIKAQMIPLKLDITDVKMSNGDFAVGSIDNALDPYLFKIANEMVTYCKGRKTLVFLPLIKTSLKFVSILNQYGLKAIDVNCKSKNRSEIINDFVNGKYEILCNSMLLTEGWDCPSVDCIVILRPTKIRSLFVQMVGRGLRLAPNKNDLLLLDFLWLTERHDLCKPASLVSDDDDMQIRISKKIINSSDALDLLDVANESKEEAVKEREEHLAERLKEMKRREKKLVDPLQYAYSIQDDELTNFEPIYEWQKQNVTESQKSKLKNLGIDSSFVKNAGEASLLIDRLINRRRSGLTTPNQIRFLERLGFLYVGTWTFKEASKLISYLSKHNWKVPYFIDPATYVPHSIKEVDEDGV